MKEPLYLLDSYALIYRSYFAFMSRPLKAPDGRNVSAVFGFYRAVLSLFDERNPSHFACVFDARAKTFRHDLYPEYKANRQKTPEDLHPQTEIVEEIAGKMGLPCLRRDGFEADDIIATLAAQCRAEDRPCYIITGDKDLLQLVGGSVRVLRPNKETGYQVIGPEEVRAEWGLPPERILDYLSLTGDASDNVPGVAGVGDKTALKVLEEFDTLDQAYARLGEVKPEGLRKKLEAGKESAFFSRKLISLVYDVPLGVNPEGLHRGQEDRPALAKAFSDLGMKSLAARFSGQQDLFGEGPATAPKPAPAYNKAPAPRPSVAQRQEAETVEVAESLKGPGSYRAVTDQAELDTLVAAALAQKRFAFDCETGGLDELTTEPLGFSIALKPKEAFYIPIKSPDAATIAEADIKRALGQLWGKAEHLIVGQNLKFDLHVMQNYGIDCQAKLEDSMVAAWLLDSGRAAYNLGALAELYLGNAGISFESLVGKGQTFADVPLEKATPYACEDADFALRLMEAFRPALEKAGLSKIFLELELPLIPLLARMERAGILLDNKALAAYSKELDADLVRIEGEIYALVGHEFNIASTKQLQEVLFVERKLKPGKKTKTGYSTDTSVLEELAAEDPVPEKILEYRGLAKLKSTYVDALPLLADSSGRVHTHYIQTGTATGRLSSRDPNLQNIPIREEAGRRIRQAFVADAGKALVSCDYSQIELVVLAHLSGDQGLRQAFTDQVDIHRRTASLIFNKAEDAVTPDERRAAKTINFGVIYGMSAFRLAAELKIPRGQAQAFIDAYFTTYSGVRDFTQRVISEAEKTGYVSTMLGRRRFVDGISSGNKTEKSAAERIALNTPIQGSAADIMKLAMLAVNERLAKDFPEALVLLQVHDELIIECPKKLAEKVAKAAKEAMESVIRLSVPLKVSAESAESWGEMH
jgi:DNA polymerase-1